MGFQDEMKQVFLRVMAGEIEPKEWETWWRAVKTVSGYYEEKAREEELRERQKALEKYHQNKAPLRQQWEDYLKSHPVEPVIYDWKKLLGTPPGQKAAPVFPYKHAREPEQWKECGTELKLRLKENLQAKIAPVAKAYGMKKAGPKTFVREKNGLVSRIQFIGYFRGGGYEAMSYYLCPIYAIEYGILGLPGHISNGEHFQKNAKWLGCDPVWHGGCGRCHGRKH